MKCKYFTDSAPRYLRGAVWSRVKSLFQAQYILSPKRCRVRRKTFAVPRIGYQPWVEGEVHPADNSGKHKKMDALKSSIFFCVSEYPALCGGVQRAYSYVCLFALFKNLHLISFWLADKFILSNGGFSMPH
jgi:hypothetical protein